jgi:flagellar biosynthesis protein FlhB
MLKYVLLGLITVIATFMIMNYWPKLQETTRNKIITSIFVFIAIGFVILISLLIF